MGFHKVKDGQIYYEYHNPSDRAGTGVLFLHGLGSCSEDWGLQIPIVRECYWVLTLDMPGHGRSSQPAGWPSIEDMALQIASVVKEQAEMPVHVVGLSLGGAVAMQLALAHPEVVRSLTLVNTFARLHSGSNGFFRKLVRISFVMLGRMDRVGQWVAAGLFPEPEQELLRQAAAERIASNPRSAYLRAIWAAYPLRHPRSSKRNRHPDARRRWGKRSDCIDGSKKGTGRPHPRCTTGRNSRFRPCYTDRCG